METPLSVNSFSLQRLTEMTLFEEMSYEELCQLTYNVGLSPCFLLLSSVGAVFMEVVFANRFFRRRYYHRNAKILIFGHLFFTFVFASSFSVGIIMHFTNVFRNYNSPCSFMTSVGDCTTMYYVHIFSLSGMVLNQLLLSVERLISSLNAKHYENFSTGIGISFLIIVIITAAAQSSFILSGFDPRETRLTCFGLPFSVSRRTNILYVLVVICDLVSIALFSVSWRKVKEDPQKYQLCRRYQHRENATIIRMFAPLSVVHFIFFGIYTIVTGVIRILRDDIDPDAFPKIAMGAMTIPYYTTVEMIVLIITLKVVDKVKRRLADEWDAIGVNQQRDRYFSVLSSQWN